MARPSSSDDVYRAIADPTRRRIIELLTEESKSAGQITAYFTACQSTVSEHLGILRRAGLITFEEQSGRRIYSVELSTLNSAALWIGRFATR